MEHVARPDVFLCAFDNAAELFFREVGSDCVVHRAGVYALVRHHERLPQAILQRVDLLQRLEVRRGRIVAHVRV